MSDAESGRHSIFFNYLKFIEILEIFLWSFQINLSVTYFFNNFNLCEGDFKHAEFLQVSVVSIYL